MDITAKRIKSSAIKIIIAMLTLIALTGMLSACGNALSGKYYTVQQSMFGKTTIVIDFKSDNKLVGTMETEGEESVEREGTYEIKDGKITMKFIGEDGEEDSSTASFEKGVDYIKIDDMVFIKKK